MTKLVAKRTVPYRGKVYDLQIKNDPSYNVSNIIVHNSAAGVLCGYLLGITKIDPLKYGLLFERFTNEGRVKISSPDIDTDIESIRRDEVKNYVERRFSFDNKERVCSIGTYTTYQLKQAIGDIARIRGVDIKDVRFFNKMLDVEQNASWDELFEEGAKKGAIMKFIQENSSLIEDIPLIKDQPKSSSIHACAVLILPQDTTLIESIPVRREEVNGEKILVSEWEGAFIEEAGFLKEDLLGILQLDKFQMIKKTIKEVYGEDIDIYDIPLDNEKVYELFSKGYNGDVFHFGAKGLTGYSRMTKPRNIEELIAMIALFRPGPIENGFHLKYNHIKEGKEELQYFKKTEDVTKETYSIICYQEQIMEICRVVGNFTLTEADDIRRAMGKKKLDVLMGYKEKFINNAMSYSQYDESEAKELWDVMEKFASYAFNKSHAACYSITGYVCQWFKVNYPMVYWMTALTFADDKKIANYLSEINLSSSIKLNSVNINKSQLTFIADYNKKEILWSISSVTQCGEVAVKAILEEREKNGDFFSLEEFLTRVEKSKVNKSVVENLILAGAFDEIENIQYPFQRKRLIQQYREINKVKVSKGENDWFELLKKSSVVGEDWWWQLQQKNVSDFALFDYQSIFNSDEEWIREELSLVETLSSSDIDQMNSVIVSTGGIVTEVKWRESKKGTWAKVILEQNYNFISLTIWADDVTKFNLSEENLVKGKLLLFKGRLVYDTFLQENALCSDDRSKLKILG